MAARLLIVLAAVVLLRLPFLHQAVQGDDVYYLAIARNASVDPLHPMQMGYTFQGQRVSMAGHPHPPLNAYVLAGLLRIFGDVRERWFHICYVAFSIIAALAMYSLACRFTTEPLLATLLFIAVPAFVVNGNSLEADLPFLALWMAGFALYFKGWYVPAAGSLALAALAAYQGVFALPILLHEAWYRRRRSPGAWLAPLAAPVALAAWQLSQRSSSGEAPAAVLAGYLQTYGLLALVKKAHSALALTGHLGWIVFPLAALWAPRLLVVCVPLTLAVALVLPGYLWWQQALLALSLAAGLAILARWLVALWKDRASDSGFLAAWGLVFFAGAVAVFFAGSARYLLPLAAPVILTVVRDCPRPRLLWGAAALNLCLGLALASANYEHAGLYQRAAADLAPLAGERRLWTNAEWGLRYYLERLGAEPLERDQPVYAGSLIVLSEAAGNVPFSTGGGTPREVWQAELRNRRPLRLFGLDTRAGYSSSDLGVLPFDVGRGRLDTVRAEIVGLPEARLSFLRMNDPAAAPQLLAGFYEVESNAWRWMSEQAVALLKVPPAARQFEVSFFIPDTAPARRLTVAVDGMSIADQRFAGPGPYSLVAPFEPAGRVQVQIVITVDRPFQPSGDQRRLGVIVQELGFR
jgi:hypothetical protein